MHSYLTLEEAAEYCRYSVSGFRKLIERSKSLMRAGLVSEIKFAQPRKGGKIVFRQEWLDEFLSPKELKPVIRIERPQKRIYALTGNGSEGFDDRLLNL